MQLQQPHHFTEVQRVSKVIALAGVLTFQPCSATTSTDKI
jgi:hypothetical protein